MVNKLKKYEDMEENELLYTLLSKKVGAINPFDVFYFKEGQDSLGNKVTTYHLGGKKIQPQQASQLRAEAKLLKATHLYKIITETLAHQAKLQMFELMKTLDDQHYGKTMLHNIGVIEKIVESLDSMPEVKLSTGK